MTDKTQATAHACIKPQCDPAKCSDCACAITPSDGAGQVVLGLLNAFAVNDLGHPFEDGDSAAVDRARQWLQNRSTALLAAPPAPASVAVPEGWTACRIEHEPGYPEDVAFGPQIMMDRLKKWLDRHFAALAAAPAQAVAVPAVFGDEDHVLVPRALIGSACSAIDKKRDGTKTLAELRRYTVGDLSAAAPAQEHATQLAGPVPEHRPNWLPFSVRTLIAQRHETKVSASFNALVRDVIETYIATHGAAPAQTPGCTRSHPHENMSPMCVLRTEIARLNHAAAVAEAKGDERSDALQDSAYAAGMLSGWNLCVADDHATFSKLRGERMTGAARVANAARAAAPAQAQEDARGALTQAARDVLAERRRQIEAEGFDNARDDKYVGLQLAGAAASYLILAAGGREDDARAFWPWRQEWLKPGDQRRYLEKAGALALAEMERLDRAAARAAQGGA